MKLDGLSDVDWYDPETQKWLRSIIYPAKVQRLCGFCGTPVPGFDCPKCNPHISDISTQESDDDNGRTS